LNIGSFTTQIIECFRHQAATLANKQQTFVDLHQCAKALLTRGYASSPKDVAVYGRAAGGLAAASTAMQW
jgi:prolyl oligopeptidase PreP (S9A serine peptidase family)